MATLSDSVTVGILLTLVFGAICFYLYSRLTLNEKRVSLLENLLLSLKMNTEASLMGPDSVEPVSQPAPLSEGDVDDVSENDYADLLKGVQVAPVAHEDSEAPVPVPVPVPAPAEKEVLPTDEESAAELLRSMNPLGTPAPTARKMDANYESMSLKELQSLVRQRGLTASSQRKRDLIDALKRSGVAPEVAPEVTPEATDGNVGGVEGVEGFSVNLEEIV